MFYFINGFKKIEPTSLLWNEVIIRNPKNTYEKSYFLKIYNDFSPSLDTFWKWDDAIEFKNKLMDEVVIVEFDESIFENISWAYLKQEALYQKYWYLINLICFISSRFKLNYTPLKLCHNYDSFFKDFLRWTPFTNLSMINLQHTFNEEDFKECFWLLEIHPKIQDRIIFLWETITLLYDTKDPKLKIVILMWILESLLVSNIDKDVKYQVKVKLISVLSQISHYKPTQSLPMTIEFYKEFNHFYTLRSLISHWSFKEIDSFIKKNFNKNESLWSVTYNLEYMAANVLFMYLCYPALFNVLKNT